MPEYLAPGVYVDEISAASRPIEGVSTSTAGFIGAARFGPVHGPLPRLTCLADFERLYGDGRKLAYGKTKVENHLWHAARAFFAEGGKALHVARVFRPRDRRGSRARSGEASARIGPVVIRARHPGAFGNFRLRIAMVAPDDQPSPGPILSLTVVAPTGEVLGTWRDLALNTAGEEPGGVAPFELFAATGSPGELPIVGSVDRRATTAEIVAALFGSTGGPQGGREAEIVLRGGNDGTPPQGADYAGAEGRDLEQAEGLRRLEAIDEIAIVAAPAATSRDSDGDGEIARLLVDHAEKMRYRVAVLDCGLGQSTAAVRKLRGQLESRSGALFMPWLLVADPRTRRKVPVPPSGFVAGRWSRVDPTRSASADARQPLGDLAVGLDRPVSEAEQQALQSEGINCFRTIPGRGIVEWGGRTLSADPEWRYVAIRRYFAYLEHSIDRGTQWVVFEPNGEPLWAKLRGDVEAFLFAEWRAGALAGDRPEAAFFVRCDRTTMTQDDLDNGRLVCVVGVAKVKPAEFIIIRIGQWTRDRKPCP